MYIICINMLLQKISKQNNIKDLKIKKPKIYIYIERERERERERENKELYIVKKTFLKNGK
jgi:hypothetical protein